MFSTCSASSSVLTIHFRLLIIGEGKFEFLCYVFQSKWKFNLAKWLSFPMDTMFMCSTLWFDWFLFIVQIWILMLRERSKWRWSPYFIITTLLVKSNRSRYFFTNFIWSVWVSFHTEMKPDQSFRVLLIRARFVRRLLLNKIHACLYRRILLV